MPFRGVINGLCPSWHWLSWVTAPLSAWKSTAMFSCMQMFHMWICCSLHIQTCPMSKTNQLLQLMTTMNTHNPALMQAWQQSPKMIWTQWVLWRNHFLQDSLWHFLFLTQAELYYHRGPAFANYSQLEFNASYNSQKVIIGKKILAIFNFLGINQLKMNHIILNGLLTWSIMQNTWLTYMYPGGTSLCPPLKDLPKAFAC